MRLLLLLAGLLLAAPAEAAPKLGEVSKAARQWVAERKAPGIVVGVMDHGRLVLVRAYGLANVELGVPARPDTVFRVGSLTKQFTAAAALRLAEQHRLSLDETIGRATLRQLLTHTGGVTSYTDRDVRPAEGWSARRDGPAMQALIAGLSPAFRFAPGGGWQYSNSGYYLAGLAVERASGQSLGAWLSTSFFTPLGMTRTAIDDERDLVPGRAAGYASTPTGFANAAWVSASVPGGAGALRSTVPDLLRWQQALLSSRVLAPPSLAAMLAPGRLADGSLARRGPSGCRLPQYGMGEYLDAPHGVRKLSHGGSIDGFRAYLASYPDRGLAFAILTNGETALAPLAQRIEDLLIGPSADAPCPEEAVAAASLPVKRP
ncbi:MAG: beta-lactamase family protein [Novosphingobium sp.]|nr:beta-lactamase family protein [Novosphingobium sp.]